MARQVIVEIIGDAKKFTKTVDDAAKKSDGFASKLGTLGKMALGAGVVGIGALASQVVAGAKALGDQEQALQISANTIKKMGDESWATKDKVAALANQIQDYSGVDNTATIKTENMLLTFGNIQDKIGKGNDVFTQSTKLAVDMSTVMGTDATQSALQLGKALNDPIKGLTALQRVGVAFTDAQKKQITALVQSGDTLGAQKIILGELSREFGGAAEAAGQGSGVFRRLGATWEDFQKVLAGAVLPVVEQAGTTFLNFIQSPGVQKAGAAISEGIGKALKTFAATVVPIFSAAVSFIVTTVLPAAVTAFNWISANVLPALTQAFAAVVGWVKANWPAISSIISQVAGAVKVAFGIIGTVIRVAWPIIEQVAKVLFPVLGAAATVLFHGMDVTFKLIGGVWSAAANVAKSIVGPITSAWNAISSVTSRIFGGVASMVKGAFNGIIGIINGVIGAINAIQVHIHMGPVNIDWSGLKIPRLPRLHTGGIVPGMPGSDVAAVLQAGERVLPRNAAPAQIIINIQGGMIDGPTMDKIQTELTRRLRYATGI
jgi:hypothetical protein